MKKPKDYKYLDDEKEGYKEYPMHSVEEVMGEDKLRPDKFRDKDYQAKYKKKQKGEPKDDYSNLNMGDPSPEDLSVKLSEEQKAELAEQVDREYSYCKDFMQPKIEKWLRRLKLLNNQRRDEDKTGDPLMFTIFNTVLSALYEDEMLIEFEGREYGDHEQASNLNALALNDYEEMDMPTIRYEQLWDAGFFGRSIISFTTFDRMTLTPVPEVIDPTTFLRDPRATSINGSKLGKNGCRFFGREIAMTKWEMERNPAFFDIDSVNSDKYTQSYHSDSDYYSLLEQARQLRADMQGYQSGSPVREMDLGDNTEFKLLEWYTHYKGEKCLVTLANDRTTVVRYQPLNCLLWEVIDTPLYPTAHDWDGTSIPDLTEDKQRLRAIIQNLIKDGAISAVHPMFAYDQTKIVNKQDLTFGFNKFVPVKGNPSGVVATINQPNINYQIADYILKDLDNSAQKATATPEIQQGVTPDQQRTLGETQLVATKSMSRYGLTAKLLMQSEKKLWRQWYYLYKTHFEEDIDEKVIRIKGAYGTKYRTITRDNIITSVDPDVTVQSKALSAAQRLQKQLRFEKYATFVAQDPTANKRWVNKELGRLNGLSPDEVERIFPSTADELQAEYENESLSKNKITEVSVSPNDNHVLHIDIHATAADTPATRAHIFAHREAIRLMKENPGLFPDASAQQFQQMGLPVPADRMMQMQQGGGGAPAPQGGDAAAQMMQGT